MGDPHVKAGSEHGVATYGNGFICIQSPQGDQYDLGPEDYDVIEWLEESPEDTDEGADSADAGAASAEGEAITEDAAVA